MSLGVTSVVIAGVSAAVGAYSAIQSGKAQRNAAAYQAQVAANNATIASYNANAATQTGNNQLAAAQEQAAQHQGMIRAVMGAGGIDLNSGSAMRTQEGTAQVDQLNEATITSNAARSAWNYRNQGSDFTAEAGLDTMRAQQAETAGMLGGISSMLSGAGQFANTWNKYYPSATS